MNNKDGKSSGLMVEEIHLNDYIHHSDFMLHKLINTSDNSSHSLSNIETTPRQSKLPSKSKTSIKTTGNLHFLYDKDQPLLESSLEYPSAFHLALCSNSGRNDSNDFSTYLDCLRIHLLARPSSCSIKDSNGRLPLHLLSLNATLLLEAPRNDLEEFIMDVFNQYPLAAITSDKDGRGKTI